MTWCCQTSTCQVRRCAAAGREGGRPNASARPRGGPARREAAAEAAAAVGRSRRCQARQESAPPWPCSRPGGGSGAASQAARRTAGPLRPRPKPLPCRLQTWTASSCWSTLGWSWTCRSSVSAPPPPQALTIKLLCLVIFPQTWWQRRRAGRARRRSGGRGRQEAVTLPLCLARRRARACASEGSALEIAGSALPGLPRAGARECTRPLLGPRAALCSDVLQRRHQRGPARRDARRGRLPH